MPRLRDGKRRIGASLGDIDSVEADEILSHVFWLLTRVGPGTESLATRPKRWAE